MERQVTIKAGRQQQRTQGEIMTETVDSRDHLNVRVNDISAFSSRGWRRIGGMFSRYERGTKPSHSIGEREPELARDRRFLQPASILAEGLIMPTGECDNAVWWYLRNVERFVG